MAKCGCGARWSGLSSCHCSGCHRLFGGIGSFDRHRRNFTCADPASAGLRLNDRGVWVQTCRFPLREDESERLEQSPRCAGKEAA